MRILITACLFLTGMLAYAQSIHITNEHIFNGNTEELQEGQTRRISDRHVERIDDAAESVSEHFARLGMSNSEALQTATRNGAELLGIVDDASTISVGKPAGLILVPAKLLEDIAAAQDLLVVISTGQVALRRVPFARAKR